MKYSIAILGKKEEILAFKGLGITTLFADTALEAEEILLDIHKDETLAYAVIFIPEDLFQNISEEVMEKISKEALPALVPVPGLQGSTGFGDIRMRKFVEQAVGSDIFAN